MSVMIYKVENLLMLKEFAGAAKTKSTCISYTYLGVTTALVRELSDLYYFCAFCKTSLFRQSLR